MWREALSEYEKMHKAESIHARHFVGGEEYHIISLFIKGVKSVDIACGEGYIEQKAPDTVGVDFSIQALYNAKKNGGNYLVQAAAEYLPFKDRAFNVAICLGSLEHFKSPTLALTEMARISHIQLLTVHAELPFPLSAARKILSRLLIENSQPIENRFKWTELTRIIQKSGLRIVFWGYHRYVGLHYLWQGKKWLGRLAKLLQIPSQTPFHSHYFVIAYNPRPIAKN